jgi:ATP-binding cassette, subfamily B, bacterial
MTDIHTTREPDGRPGRGAVFAESVERDGEKRGKSRNLRPLARLWPYVLRRPVDLFFALVFLGLAAGTTLMLPLAARQLVDQGFSSGNILDVNERFGFIFLIVGVMAISSAARFYFVTKIGERVVADLRADVYDHLVGLSPGFFGRLRTGEALSRLTTDATLIETLVGSSASVALRNIIMLIGALAMLLAVNVKLTLALLLIVPAILVPIFVFGRQVRTLSTLAQDRVADASANASETLDAIETVQAFGREGLARKTFRDSVEAAFAAARKRILARSLMTAIVIAMVFGGVAIVLWLGAQSVMRGEVTAGALTQFVFLSVLAATGAGALAEVWGDVQKAAGATQRLAEILEERPEIAAPANPVGMPDPPRGEVRFDEVRFAYPGSDGRKSLNGLSFHVNPGETVALVGPSGAGKSTVFKLLLRFYDPQSGAVLVDDVEALAADPGEWRARFSYVAQDSPLFTGSAADNVRFARADASDDAVRGALKRARADDFILDRGGMTEGLGDRGKRLSGGERQRIAVARALVRNAPILLLDEATSALDAENEAAVQAALAEARKGRTTLVIAHRLATVLEADRILVMDGGRIVEEGRHEDLIAKGGLYARFAALQFDRAFVHQGEPT